MSGAPGGWSSQRLKSALRGLFGALALASLAVFAWRSRDLLAGTVAAADFSLLALAVTLWALLHGLSALFTVLMVRACGGALGYPAFGAFGSK